VIVGPAALARRLRPRVVAPTSVASLLADHEAAAAFRRLVEELFPADWRALWDAREEGADREAARVWAFSARVGAELFPVFECEQYAQVAFEVPVVRFGWSFDRYHDLSDRPGEHLLLALCAAPFTVDDGARLAVLDAAEALVGRELVARVPVAGFEPAVLHERLDGTPYTPAADFADWLFGQIRSDLAVSPMGRP
jgi:hypothetical protein